jgi:Xaa-Pro aminopeptidase/Xaa-Pro dipeptidase
MTEKTPANFGFCRGGLRPPALVVGDFAGRTPPPQGFAAGIENHFSRSTIPFPAQEYTARLGRLRRRLAAAKFDAVLIEDETNRMYFTGLEATNGVLCVCAAEEKPLFLTDFRYLEAARSQLGSVRVSLMKRDSRYGALVGPARRGRWARVGYDGPGTLVALERMKRAMPDVSEWASCQAVVDGLRVVKSPREIGAIRNAVRMGDAVYARLLEEVRPGQTEWAIRVRLRGWMDAVSQGESFETIVCVGSNASRCHHHSSQRVLRRGQELLIDMGVKVDGYCSDMTRVAVAGSPSPKLREIHRIVLEANRRAVAGIRAGITCHAADALARRVIDRAGYGANCGHGIGHGVGLQVHDPGSLREGNQEVLRAGMVMTVEPGIYLPGVCGVRIEDMVVVREGGCELLTGTPRDLRRI